MILPVPCGGIVTHFSRTPKLHGDNIFLRNSIYRNSLTKPFTRDTFYVSHDFGMSRAFPGPLTGRTHMAPHELIAPETCFIGIRAERNALEANSDHTNRVPKHYLQQKNELLAKGKLRQQCILEEACQKHFRNVPPALPPCQIPNDIPSQADPKRAPADLVFSRPTAARDFERHAPQRGCKFHSPELTVWSGLFYVPPAQRAALAWGNNLL